MKTQVIIVGAGPTGLMAACQLARFHINFVIIDAKRAPTKESRALLLTPRSLEIYQQMGLADSILQQGKAINGFSFFVNGEQKATIKTTNAGKGFTEFDSLLSFEQWKNETLLYQYLKDRGKEVQWNTTLTKLVQDTNGIAANLYNADNLVTVKADYLLACDGASSAVRHLLGATFKGGTYKNKFYVADLKLTGRNQNAEANVYLSRKDFCAIFPLNEKGNFRLMGTLPQKMQDSKNIEPGDLLAAIQETVQINLIAENVNWFSVYKLHHRCADKFQIGKCFLLGDAAHIHSPAGAQGMNTGLQDAYNISWKLAMVIKRISSERLLLTYQAERYPVIRQVLRYSDTLFGLMTSKKWPAYYFRRFMITFVLQRIISLRRIRISAFKAFSQIAYTYRNSPLSQYRSGQKLAFSAGDRCPYVLDDHGNSTYLLLKEAKFHLLCIASEQQIDNIPAPFNGVVSVIYIKNNSAWKLLGVSSALYILLRPDNYIGLISDTINPAIINSYFNNI